MLDVFLEDSMWDAAVRLATPIAFAALACLICARAGILYVGVEGVALISAFFSIAGTLWTDSPALGLGIGLAAGVLSSLLLGVLSMHLGMGDVIAGVVYLFGAIGITGFLWSEWFPDIPSIGTNRVPALWGDPEFLSPALHQSPLVYLAVLATIGIALYLKTAPGLRTRACGEAPPAARALGVNVRRARYRIYAVAGLLAGFSGSFLGLIFAGTFDADIVGGRGYVGLACVLLGALNPKWVLAAAFFFGTVDAYSFQADVSADIRDWLQILPFVLTIIAVAWFGQRTVINAAVEPEDPVVDRA